MWILELAKIHIEFILIKTYKSHHMGSLKCARILCKVHEFFPSLGDKMFIKNVYSNLGLFYSEFLYMKEKLTI